MIAAVGIVCELPPREQRVALSASDTSRATCHSQHEMLD